MNLLVRYKFERDITDLQKKRMKCYYLGNFYIKKKKLVKLAVSFTAGLDLSGKIRNRDFAFDGNEKVIE